MTHQDFIRRAFGRLWIMDHLAKNGPSRPKAGWHPVRVQELHERGLIQKSTSCLHGWEITAAGRKALEVDE